MISASSLNLVQREFPWILCINNEFMFAFASCPF